MDGITDRVSSRLESPRIKLSPTSNRRASTAPAMGGQSQPPVRAGGPVEEFYAPQEAKKAATIPTRVTINGFGNARISSAMARAPRFPTSSAAIKASAAVGMARARNKGKQGRNEAKKAVIERAREKAKYGCATLPGIALAGIKPTLYAPGADPRTAIWEGGGATAVSEDHHSATVERHSLFGMDSGLLFGSVAGRRAKALARASLRLGGSGRVRTKARPHEHFVEELDDPQEVVLPRLFQIVMQNSLLHRAKQKLIKSSSLHQERVAAEHEFQEMHNMIQRLRTGELDLDSDEDNDGGGLGGGGNKKARRKMPNSCNRRNSMDEPPLSTLPKRHGKSAKDEWALIRDEKSHLEFGLPEAVNAVVHEERFAQLGSDKLSRYEDIWKRRCGFSLDEPLPLSKFCVALSRVNSDLVSPSQIEYCMLCLDFLQEMNTRAGGAGDGFASAPHVSAVNALHGFDEFKLVAALSDRLKVFAEYTQPFFEDLDFTDAEGLHDRLKRARDLFYLSDGAQLEGLMTYEEFEVLCFAGNIFPGVVGGVLRRMLDDHKPGVDFLDFLSNLPLFVHIHEEIVGESILTDVKVTQSLGRHASVGRKIP